jgi:hypothetical protein
MGSNHHPVRRPRKLDGAPLDYAPENEQGVVYLFASLQKKYGVRIAQIQSGYPDCIAYHGEKRIRIEFEYRSSNFVQHKHDPNKCDWIVCWKHDSYNIPKRIRIIELRRHFGHGWEVWVKPVGTIYKEILAKSKWSESWSVPSQANEGDLVLYYANAPEKHIADIFTIDGEVGRVRADWKPGMDYMAPIRRVCRLKAPLLLSELKSNRETVNAGFVRGQVRTHFNVSAYWPVLYRMIAERNRAVVPKLSSSFAPDRITY